MDSLLASARLPGSIGHEECPDEDGLDDSVLSVSLTKLHDRTKRQSDPSRYVDPAEVPFVTLSIRRAFRATGVALGDITTVVNRRTGRHVHAIVGDDREVLGAEPSLYLSEALELTLADEAIYLVHPGSGLGPGIIPGVEAIEHRGDQLYDIPEAGSMTPWSEVLNEYLVRRPRP